MQNAEFGVKPRALLAARMPGPPRPFLANAVKPRTTRKAAGMMGAPNLSVVRNGFSKGRYGAYEPV